MGKVYRLFVEKKPGFDVEAQQLLRNLQTNLGLTAIRQLRLLNRYDVEGLCDEDFAAARSSIFSEPNKDIVYDDHVVFDEGWLYFAMEYVPGQYDQRADSAAQCVQLLTQKERPKVLSATVVAISGEISETELLKVQNYCINPIESRIAGWDKPKSLDLQLEQPEMVETVEGFISMDAAALEAFWQAGNFAMNLEDLEFCQDYFKEQEGRDPFITELRVIDTYWSDHCRHTTFSTQLEEVTVIGGEAEAAIEGALQGYFELRRETGREERPVCLMDMATIGTSALKKRGLVPDLDESEEINACSIRVPVEIDGESQDWLVQFKNETHNHPTEIEPFGGAATCLGGAIRDPLSGRAYVYQAMRVTGSGDPDTPFHETLPGKLPQRRITVGAADGYSSYGNQIGVATGQVVELYDEGYVAKRMEIGAVVGACPADNVVRETPKNGDVVVLLGGRTGRDGIGGATGSSKAHDESSIDVCGSQVQKGNAPTERNIQRLFRKSSVSRMIKKCNDFGAGGVSVAIGELAAGLKINLDAVPKKYEGLDGTELAISESQERMAVVLDAQDAERFIAEAAAENLEATVVAQVTDDRRLRMAWQGEMIVDISRDFLDTNGVLQKARAEIAPVELRDDYRINVPRELAGRDIVEAFYANLRRKNVCSQQGLGERFDSTVGAASVLMPFGGVLQRTPEEAMVATLPVLSGETEDATAMAYGFIPGISKWSPFHSGAFAVVEALSKLAAVGADPLTARLSLQEYFERLRKEPRRWGKPVAAVLGALAAQIGLGVPAIGGKDSMSGSFEEMDVPPTLVCFALAMTKASRTISASLKRGGNRVVLLPVPLDELHMPDWAMLRRMYGKVYEMAQLGQIYAASVVREGGVAAAVTRMVLGNEAGFSFDSSVDETLLFAPQSGGLVLEIGKDVELGEVAHVELGMTTMNPCIRVGGKDLRFEDLAGAYMSGLDEVFPLKTEYEPTMQHLWLYHHRNTERKSARVARPRVLIPVFPGTNCEVETQRAFERAGAVAETVVVNNLSAAGIEQTISRLKTQLDNSQILMLPGGFSGGDEPDGCGKFIATTFRNPRLSDAVHELLARDGLILGICNGFQALVKLGLLPYGEIRDLAEGAPTLSFNAIGRHVSRIVNTRVVSVKSPWLAACRPGEKHALAVSHGEGRFVAREEEIKLLMENGQIATQYIDIDGAPTSDSEWNPNGSDSAIEGIISPDGRIFGKMGHSERIGRYVAVNVPGNKDQKLFESGVKYFA
ncbi:MAG: phosphoribosylformylglycinamidine synthase [Christensenellales bacterium]|jgi:phosphoribosylformylglycinamidine synthase